MGTQTKTRRAGGAAGLGNAFPDSSEIPPKDHLAQEAIAHLQRDFAAETLRVAAVKAAHAADDILLGDDVGAEREIRQAISHLRAGSAAFREMQGAIDGPADALLTRPEAAL